MIYRKATLKDYESICQLRQQLKHDASDNISTEYARYCKKNDRPWIKKCLRSRKIHILVAAEQDIIFGHAIVLIESVMPKMKKYYTYTKKATLVHLYVDQQKRHQGIATHLVRFTLKYLKQKRVDFVDLDCHVSNTAAATLYHQLGFQDIWVKKRISFN